jgi:hypothetical protein
MLLAGGVGEQPIVAEAVKASGIVSNSMKASSIEFLSKQVPSDDLSNVTLAEYPPHLATEIIKTARIGSSASVPQMG